MKKLLCLLMTLLSISAFAQQMEHGALVGAGVGFPMQDNEKIAFSSSEFIQHSYQNKVKAGGMLGYRLRFLPERKSFFDVDFTLGLQGMNSDLDTWKYTSTDGYHYNAKREKGSSLSQFFMPISVAASWNYRLSSKFSAGVGVAPTLYVSPDAAFDMNVMAKVGYRVSNRCELGISYQYGCLNVMKHFNEKNTKGRQGHFSDLMFSVYVPFKVK